MDYEAAGDASVSYMAPTWLLYLSSRKINWFNLSEGQFGSIHHTNANTL